MLIELFKLFFRQKSFQIYEANYLLTTRVKSIGKKIQQIIKERFLLLKSYAKS